MAGIEYFGPTSLGEAVELKSKYASEARIFAGGTDIIVNLRDRVLQVKYLIDIKKIPEMQELSYTPERGLIIGGAVTINQLLEAKSIVEHYPILVQAGKSLANTLIRNRATLVGNLCNASPAADMAPASLVLGARVVVVSQAGWREIPVEQFFTGVKRNALKPDELVVRVEIPPVKGKGVYLKKSRIKGHDLAQVGVAGFLSQEGVLRLALGAMAPTPILARGLDIYRREDLKQEEKAKAIIEQVMAQVDPISDQRASREYRLAMARYLLRQVLGILSEGV
ncbi:carbon-monoxide dehydrogenase medium subunit [Thermanaeromonas toyohensis ToBE]|uniref:Carbon-monoxide dehydrogenase medium subunit n=1 Tax=Thermanaeromonas toyohensis ToBE TaxID=698762 RepID=A0A1W1W2B5_9FIRM|nr:xanthine dehydrogenase family protein subunit M [Thermanaeromonas toyohensis]SMB99757.1 carbon-monoxide dehydrogenase medium subunit [Thermanaeromonas toyohensis ToBE]